jgi:cation:H+ antiporter
VLAEEGTRGGGEPTGGRGDEQAALWPAVTKMIAASAVVLIAGYALASTGEAIAHSTGIGSNLVGLVLVGFATSLPEVSSIYGSVRRKRYEMAIGEIFGTNLWDLVLIFLIDLLYRGDAILNLAGPFESFATLLGMVLTCLYLIGLLERRDRTIARMGYDSLAVMIVYAGGLCVLWFLQGHSAS